MACKYTRQRRYRNLDRTDMFANSSLLLLTAVAAYALGSIPFGLIFTRLTGRGDIRQIGSGNIGATNVLRTGSRPLAALTLIFDAGKGAVAVLIAEHFAGPQTAALAGALAGALVVIGHCFPVWLKFSGGKGVATSLAVFAAIDLRLGGTFVIVWLLTAFITRYSSLAALCAVLTVACGGFLMLQDHFIQVTLGIVAGLVWVRHHANIGRLLAGTETKIGAK
jgi:glycerol-3-phosphate acyltransferase PlsY